MHFSGVTNRQLYTFHGPCPDGQEKLSSCCCGQQEAIGGPGNRDSSGHCRTKGPQGSPAGHSPPPAFIQVVLSAVQEKKTVGHSNDQQTTWPDSYLEVAEPRTGLLRGMHSRKLQNLRLQGGLVTQRTQGCCVRNSRPSFVASMSEPEMHAGPRSGGELNYLELGGIREGVFPRVGGRTLEIMPRRLHS